MNTIARKTLALLLSASLFSSYAVPSYATETVTGEKTVTGTDSAATSNQTTGVYQVGNTGSLTVTGNAVFDNNSSSVDDGAAINNSGSLTVDNSQFNNNSVNYDGGAGGALFLKGNNSINNSSFDGNSVTGNYGGGALYLSNKSESLVLTNSDFTNNTATNFNDEEDAAGGAVALLKKAELDNVTFTGNKTVSSVDLGLGGGGAMFIGAEGKIEIEDSRFTENVSATDGGAIATRTQPPADNKDASLDIEETIFEKNIASGKGGAIWNNFYNSKEVAGYVNVEDSTFAQNSAQQGGAIFNDQNGKIRVEDGTFNNNLASTAGGAIYNNETLVISGNSTFSGNKVTTDGYDGGAIYNKGNLTIEQGATFTGNESDWGGALFLEGTNSITGATFTSNKVEGTDVSGGALYLGKNAIELTLKDSTFTANSATNTGSTDDAAGGAASLMEKATVDNVTFTNNQVLGNKNDNRGGGGALFLGAEGKITIANSTFTSNHSSSVGGAIATRDENAPAVNIDASLDISNSTFTDNTASGNGGAFYNNFYNSTSKEGAVYVANSSFTGNKAGQYGGAIHNKGSLEVISSTFQGNTAQVSGGAIASTTSSNTKVDGSTFTDNHAKYDGGAIGNFNGLTITNSTFENNTAQMAQDANGNWTVAVTDDTAPIGGGAIALGAVSATQVASVSNTSFKGNKSGRNGGAIGTRLGNDKNDNKAATLDIAATFENNEAYEDGGAIYNTFYTNNGLGKGEGVTVTGSFTSNYAHQNGGAIYNSANTDKNGKSGVMTITDATFTNNKADGEGGAIYNASALTLAGTNTFTGNTAAGVANDIHNMGTLNIGGTATFEGGITGTGSVNVTDGATVNLGLGTIEADSIAFANGTTLGVTLASDTMGNLKANTVTVGESSADTANLIVTVSTDFATADQVTQQLINSTEVTGSFAMADVTNALYNVSFDATTNKVTAIRKSQEEQTEAITEAGGNANNLEVIEAFTSSSDLGSAKANEVSNIINTLAQTDTVAAVKATTALAPETASAKQAIQGSVTREVFNVLQGRMNDVVSNAPSMYALGNTRNLQNERNYAVWLQGLANKSHKENTSDSAAFTGRSTGLSFGVDTQLDDNTLVGLGYAYTHTNVSSFLRHNRIDGNTFFLYGQYRPSQFYVQGSLAYGDSKYEEEKYVSSVEVNANYHVKTYAAQATAGYDVNEWVSPNFALRYMNLQQESYTDGADQSVSASQDNYLTAVLGVDLQTQKRVSSTLSLLPRFHAGISYDLLSDKANSRVTLPNASGYNVTGERLHRLSFEAGASVTAQVADNVEALLGYEGNFREDYNSHTGMLKLRYFF